ncbi:Uncharacterised protein [Corynebacterium pilosum]|uniref:Uncharacterized protein n=1 Tax=Corynebacterium pilosum TaxID=35756 RepID=A0A376CP23_9CORY|nr:Uncharacterised protein [Corynebacterium pilosum]
MQADLRPFRRLVATSVQDHKATFDAHSLQILDTKPQDACIAGTLKPIEQMNQEQ